MGIRMHRQIGWGLTDLLQNDDRINWDVVRKEVWDIETEDYITFLESVVSEDEEKPDVERDFSAVLELQVLRSALNKGDRLPHVTDAVTWDDEGGLPNVILISPLWLAKKWSRYDDAIDRSIHDVRFYGQLDKYTQPEVDVIPVAPFPYNGLYINKLTGESLPPQSVRAWKYAMESEDLQQASLDDLDALTMALVGMSYHEACEYIVDEIPREILRLAGWINLFTDFNDTLELKPLLYTYWG